MSSTRGPRLPDRSLAAPLWRQVHDDLVRRIAAKAFSSGFPGEHALVDEYEVSRHTIREALRVLRDNGVVHSERGRQSRVTQPGYTQSVQDFYSIWGAMRDRGVSQRSVVRRCAATQNATVAKHLGLRGNAKLLVIERVRIADGEPLAHDTAWLPWARTQALVDVDFANVGLYEALAAQCDVWVDGGHESITAITAPRHIATLLELPAHAAVHHIERLAFAAGVPVEWRETHVRGDRFTLDVAWPAPASSSDTEGV